MGPGTFSITTAITDAGDSGVLLPVALVCAATLWFYHSRQLAWLLLRTVLLACVMIAVLKIAFLSCGTRWQTGLVSPSGHACLSAVVYGVIGTILSAGRSMPARIAIATAVIGMILAVAVTRVLMGIHTLPEVLVGLGVGGLALLHFAYSYSRMQPLRVDLSTFSVAMVATVLVAFGTRLPAESILRHIAKRLSETCAHAPAVQPDYRAGIWAPSSRSKASTSSARSRAVWS